MLGRKPGHGTGTAALEGIDFWIAAEPAYLKSNELLDFAPRREAIGQLTKKCLSFAGPRLGCCKHCCGTTCGIENTFEASRPQLLRTLAQVTDF